MKYFNNLNEWLYTSAVPWVVLFIALCAAFNYL